MAESQGPEARASQQSAETPPDHVDPELDLPHHLPFGSGTHHRHPADDEPVHNELQDGLEHFFGALGGFISSVHDAKGDED